MTATTPRPATFDATVMAYMPGLKNLARRLVANREAQTDLVTDTVISALHRWQSFRDEGNIWTWLSLVMRSCARENRDKVRRRIQFSDDKIAYEGARTNPSQHVYAEVSSVLDLIDGRDRTVLMRRAMGYELEEIGDVLGVTAERVRQIETKARVKLTKRASLRRVAA